MSETNPSHLLTHQHQKQQATPAAISLADALLLLQRVETLLRAGIPLSRVFHLIDDLPNALHIQKETNKNHSIPQAIASLNCQYMRLFAALWHIAENSGAPLADAVHRLNLYFQHLDTVQKRTKVLLTAPKYMLLLVALLPILALGMGELLGFHPLAVFQSVFAIPLTLLGGFFLGSAFLWIRGMIKKAAKKPCESGIECELLAVALSSGMPLQRAKRLVADSIDTYQANLAALSQLAESGQVTEILKQAESTGHPHKPALIQASQLRQSETITTLEADAEKLAIRVLIPLSVCALPGFVILGIIPTIISMLGIVPP